LNQWLESEPLFDWVVAAYNGSRLSARKIEPFIRRHHIDMSEFKPATYRSFGEFFDREIKPRRRPFPEEPSVMGAFAEARYFAWELACAGAGISDQETFAAGGGDSGHPRARVARELFTAAR
jgi:hypothetical protein